VISIVLPCATTSIAGCAPMYEKRPYAGAVLDRLEQETRGRAFIGGDEAAIPQHRCELITHEPPRERDHVARGGKRAESVKIDRGHRVSVENRGGRAAGMATIVIIG
jgi:hypothetical protein